MNNKNPLVEESTVYESFEGHKGSSGPTLPNAGKVEEEWRKDVDLSTEYYQKITASFRNNADFEEFQILIGLPITHKMNEFWYPLAATTEKTLEFKFDADYKPAIVPIPITPKKVKTIGPQLNIDVEDLTDPNHWENHWKGMPEFVQEDNPPARKLTIYFRTEEDRIVFSNLINQDMTEKTKSIWHPKLDRTANAKLRWVE